jgi:hypothetical protein
MQLVKSPQTAKRIGDRDSQRLFAIEFNLRTLDFQQSLSVSTATPERA